ncbi:MAG: hypothetical protein ACRAVC_23655 [Trichormus sp.]
MVNRTQNQSKDALANQDKNNINSSKNSQDNEGIESHARGLLQKFVSSVQTLVEDITALEVNTMVVTRISGNKFSAWEAYQEIYSIHDQDYFAVMKIPKELHIRYKDLFAQLEREYFYILIENPIYSLNNSQNEKLRRYHQRLHWLKEIKKGKLVESDPRYIELARPILPAPAPVIDDINQTNQKNWQQEWQSNCNEIKTLLNNDKFVRTLRKLIELKAALDGGDVTDTHIDTIYAQTVMQLDGDIITRYHKDLFSLPEDAKNLILQIHNEGVVAGEKQWRGILDFMINLVKSLANLSTNGQK